MEISLNEKKKKKQQMRVISLMKRGFTEMVVMASFKFTLSSSRNCEKGCFYSPMEISLNEKKKKKDARDFTHEERFY